MCETFSVVLILTCASHSIRTYIIPRAYRDVKYPNIDKLSTSVDPTAFALTTNKKYARLTEGKKSIRSEYAGRF